MTDRYFSIVFDTQKMTEKEKQAIFKQAQIAFQDGKAFTAGWVDYHLNPMLNEFWVSVKEHGLPKQDGKYLVYGDNDIWATDFNFGSFDINHELVTHYQKVNFPN